MKDGGTPAPSTLIALLSKKLPSVTVLPAGYSPIVKPVPVTLYVLGGTHAYVRDYVNGSAEAL